MSAQYETGHAKNLAAFQQAIICCKSYGAAYNPGNTKLATDKLDEQYTAAATAFNDWQSKVLLNAKAVDDRTKAFSNIKTYATRIINALIAAGADQITLQTAKTFNRKIQGQRASNIPPAEPGQPQPDTNSSSQQSYDNLIQHLKGLVGLVALLPDYSPNEAELKLTGLNTYIDQLNVVNQTAIQAEANLSTARLQRDNLFYDNPNSLGKHFAIAKAYVKSIFGAKSNEYKQISSISFKPR